MPVAWSPPPHKTFRPAKGHPTTPRQVFRLGASRLVTFPIHSHPASLLLGPRSVRACMVELLSGRMNAALDSSILTIAVSAPYGGASAAVFHRTSLFTHGRHTANRHDSVDTEETPAYQNRHAASRKIEYGLEGKRPKSLQNNHLENTLAAFSTRQQSPVWVMYSYPSCIEAHPSCPSLRSA